MSPLKHFLTLLLYTNKIKLNFKILNFDRKDGKIELSLKREEIKTKSVPYYGVLPNSETGYIKLTAFTENCSNEVKEALLDLKNKNCKKNIKSMLIFGMSSTINLAIHFSLLFGNLLCCKV